jgi:ABC-2 type transport system permease protein
MADTAGVVATAPRLGLLLRVRARTVYNRVGQAIRGAPIRLAAAVFLVSLIWLGLYGLFRVVFMQLSRTPLEATVAIPMVFNFFFAAMLALLAFSNAIIAYGALFGQNEASYLLTLPLAPLDVVSLKYLESLVLASWSVVLLGLPLMFAMAEITDQPLFYALFLAFFLAFIPIPASLGMLLAWGVARFFPRRLTKAATITAAIMLVFTIASALRALRIGDTAAEVWLRSFLNRMGFVQSALLPNNWVAAGIDHAVHGQFSEAARYLGVTLANAFFLSWLAVTIVSKYFDTAYDRATSGRLGGKRAAAEASGGAAGWVFCYLDGPLRLVAAKDLRTFLRDPGQWSQLTILFGLLVLYLTNMPTLRLEFSASGWFLIIPFLNLCAVSLILATFTCRFVFPLVSLEGQKLWLIGVLPMRRGRLLLAKFAFSMTVTLLVAVGSMSLAAYMLHLDVVWTTIHLVVTFGICFGLCGFSVGIGARLPVFGQTNVARIANGLGGTLNLLASVALVALVLTGVGIATWRCRNLSPNTLPDARSLLLCAASIATSIAAGLWALRIGARHFDRVQV